MGFRTFVIAFVIVLSIISVSASFLNRARERHLKHLHELSRDSLPGAPVAQWFEQELDHFDFQEQRTWQQRYWVNATWFNPGLGGPVFFQIGGEGALSSSSVTRLAYNTWAQKEGAIIVALEHRFYGASHPFMNLSTPNLAFLNSEQALADAARFLEWFLEEYPTAGPVITFGGSYPGALAAWFRLKYPHLTVGAIASSAPVEAVLDMISYLEVVEESLEDFAGKACISSIQQATDRLQALLLTPDGQRSVQKLFKTCTLPSAPLDIANFISDLMGNFMGVVQYNGEIPTSPTINTVCGIMNNASIGDPLVRYSVVNSLFAGPGCLDISYANMIRQLSDVNAWGETGVGIRQWTYQTCAEFGYFQTTDSDNQPFGDLVPLSFYTQICKDLFNFDFDPRIEETNIMYGGKDFAGSNVVFVNGSVDPWHSLSIIQTTSRLIQAIYIQGTAHCADMLQAKPSSPPGLIKAQTQIAAIIHQWIVDS